MDATGDVRRRARRLGMQVAGVLLALIAALGVMAYWLYESNEHAAAEQRLREAVSRMHTEDAEHGPWVVVLTATGVHGASGLPAGLPLEDQLRLVEADGRPRQTEAEVADHVYFVRTQPHHGVVVQAAMDGTASEQASGRMVMALLAAGGVGVVLVAVIAGILARRTLEPVTEALQMQRRFVSDASHELRTPLTLLSTRVQILARRLRSRRVIPDSLDRDLTGVLRDTEALTGILDDLLLAASPGMGPRVPCDVPALVRSVIHAAAASAMTQGVELRPGTLHAATVSGSPVALRRAVTSLVDNAVGHARSVVEIEVRTGRREVEVEIRDDGPGIAPDRARRIFERFSSTRSEAPAADGRRHYGLGLALVADVAAAHGGSVSVRLAPEKPGATLVLTLPRAVGSTTHG